MVLHQWNEQQDGAKPAFTINCRDQQQSTVQYGESPWKQFAASSALSDIDLTVHWYNDTSPTAADWLTAFYVIWSCKAANGREQRYTEFKDFFDCSEARWVIISSQASRMDDFLSGREPLFTTSMGAQGYEEQVIDNGAQHGVSGDYGNNLMEVCNALASRAATAENPTELPFFRPAGQRQPRRWVLRKFGKRDEQRKSSSWDGGGPDPLLTSAAKASDFAEKKYPRGAAKTVIWQKGDN